MQRAKAISKSMMAYLKRAREHKEFLLKETKEFEQGKRHLANIMGIQLEEMTQADIDDAIKYLFPSGLFEKRAWPMMKHPDLIYKAQKEAQFDENGRPHHYLFYTTLPNYYEKLSQLAQLLRDLNKYEDEQIANGVLDPPSDSRYSMIGRSWITVEETRDMLLEQISDADYDYLIQSLNHLTKHPYSRRAQTFIDGFNKELIERSLNIELPELIRDETTGQIYTVMTERKREHRVEVKTVLNGTGVFDIDGDDILYFKTPYYRAAILHPLRVANMQDKVDIYAKVVARPVTQGQGSIAGAIRSAVSRSIAAFVDEATRERLRLSGLLTRDTRLKERKKFGQEGARRKYTWKKR